MRDSENINTIATLNLDYLGFIFFPKSKRNAELFLDEKVFANIPQRIKKVGVFVDASIEYIEKIASKFPLDVLQLHGNESVEFCSYFKSKYEVIKVFSVDNSFDFKELQKYNQVVDYFLFDTKTELKGGSGQKFDWNLLISAPIEKPFFLSGGISVDDIEVIKTMSTEMLYALDVNSKFEIEPGMKDIEKTKNLIAKIKIS